METRHRLGGLLCLVIAAAAFWWGIWSPLQQADAGAATIRWAPRLMLLVSMCVVFGVFFLATGGRYPYRDAERQTFTPVGWVLVSVFAVVSLGGYYGMTVALSSMGYR